MCAAIDIGSRAHVPHPPARCHVRRNRERRPGSGVPAGVAAGVKRNRLSSRLTVITRPSRRLAALGAAFRSSTAGRGSSRPSPWKACPVRDPARGPDAERGMALAVALLVLLVLSLFMVVTMTTLNSDTKIIGNNVRSSQALNFAEAGVSEAAARICSGDVPDSLSPRMVTQIFLAAPGFVPTMGKDTTALSTSQPEGSWLRYSSAGRDPTALTVTYKTDAARSVIYRYDPLLEPAIQTSSGMPIFRITSTGRSGMD